MTMAPVPFRKHQRGVAAVEFGLLIIPLTLMLFGLAEYGRAIYQYNTLVKATRDATRYLTTVAPGTSEEIVECLVLYGEQAPGCPDNDPADPNPAVLAPYLTKNMVSISGSVVDVDGNAVNLVTVTISGYRFNSLINFPIGGLSVGAPDITFGDISNTMRQVL